MESHACKCVAGVNWPVTWGSNWWVNPTVVHLQTLPIVGRGRSVVSVEVGKVKSSGGMGTGGKRWQMQLPRAISKGSMCMHALPREGKAVKSLSLLGKGGLYGDPPPGRRDFGPFSQEGRSLKKGSLCNGSAREACRKLPMGLGDPYSIMNNMISS